MGFWAKQAEQVVNETMNALPDDATRADAEQALREAYPFGERKYSPYKTWLRHRKRALDARFPEQGKGAADLPLFEQD
jgi:hypothetical protein